mmetsp:Transcript_17851/g.36011  ORF Transcript_17851/g.36011 Transcript_17851/m.36011 type:complete len:151 (-) Transcript_17851:566-1018(-)
MNYNTLHMPLTHAKLGQDAELRALLKGLLDRDASLRLGGRGDTEVVEHAFFQSVEWELLEACKLPPPYWPDASVVYAKDSIIPISKDERIVQAMKQPQVRYTAEIKPRSSTKSRNQALSLLLFPAYSSQLLNLYDGRGLLYNSFIHLRML